MVIQITMIESPQTAWRAHPQHLRLFGSAAPPADRAIPLTRLPTRRAHPPPDIHIVMVRHDVPLVLRVPRPPQLPVPEAHEVQEAPRDPLEHVGEVCGGLGGEVGGLVDLDEPGLEVGVEEEVKAEHREEGVGAVGVCPRAAAEVRLEVVQQAHDVLLHLVEDRLKVDACTRDSGVSGDVTSQGNLMWQMFPGNRV